MDCDDEIKIKDIPERFFDWNVPFHGATDPVEVEKDDQNGGKEGEEATWVMGCIMLGFGIIIGLWIRL
eukprot:12192748-Ditylum_brightwellii.AAC.1